MNGQTAVTLSWNDNICLAMDLLANWALVSCGGGAYFAELDDSGAQARQARNAVGYPPTAEAHGE